MGKSDSTFYPCLFPQDSLSPSAVSSPSSFRLVSQIIGAEDDYFDSDQEQVFFLSVVAASMSVVKGS